MDNPLDAKQKIFIATLNIIRNQGMRAVRHRAVAEEAKVSLGSTTYHFKNLDELIASTFVYWMDKDEANRVAKLSSIESLVNDVKLTKSQDIVAPLLTAACDFLHTQVIVNRDDRFIELAFHNEAIRNKQLSQLILESWRSDSEKLTGFYQALGSSTPELNAEDTLALILQLERSSLLYEEAQLEQEFNKMTLTLKHHLEKALAEFN